VVLIMKCQRQWVTENCCCQVECNPVLPAIQSLLVRIPFEMVLEILCVMPDGVSPW